jgi:microcystin-dependent protein
MSNYTKIQNWVSLTGTTISGTPFDTEFAAVATASATKSNKKIPGTANNLASLSSSGDLQDSGVSTSSVVDAIAAAFQTGDVKTSAIDSEPTGWLYCDGTSYSTSAYSDLFAAIGYSYGGSGASFNVPDLRGRTPVGIDNLGGSSANTVVDAAADAVGGTAGTETHVLTEAEMAEHTHVIDVDTYDGHDQNELKAGINLGDGYEVKFTDTITVGAHTHVATAAVTGSDAAHNNMQPSLFMNYLIKT